MNWPCRAICKPGVACALVATFLLLALAVPQLRGQDSYPKAEIFGGYSFSHVQDSISNGDGNLNGWGASLTGNMSRYVGLTADFSGTYGSETVSPVCLQIFPLPSGCTAQKKNLSAYHLLGGPRLAFPTHGVMPFAHALFGITSLHGENRSQTTFAMGFGGGVDVPFGKHLAYRLFQVDYIPARQPFSLGGWDHNIRVQTGLVFRLGK